jgi:heme/copper-type cytochrome/quinol oxidase subunit 1
LASNVILLACLIAAPLVVQLRGARPAVLFFAAAIAYASVGAVNFVHVQQLLRDARTADPSHGDTYYVVSHAHHALSLGFILAALGVLTWLQTKFGAMRYPCGTKVLFWLLHLSLIGSSRYFGFLAFVFRRPRRYVEYPDIMSTYSSLAAASGFVSSMTVLAIVAVLLWSVFLKVRS